MAGEDKKNKKEVHNPCEVCKINLYDNEDLEKLVCKECQITVHRYCYAPDVKEKQKFKCDDCKKKAQHKNNHPHTIHCSYCGKTNGILKEVGNGQWMHILCALSSPRTKLTSYKTLNFSVLQSQPKRSKIANTKKCKHCNFANNEGLHCWQQSCEAYIHMDCVISYTQPQNQDLSTTFLTIGLLDKHENSLLVHLRSELENFRGLSLLKQTKEEIKYLVCSNHNNEQWFVWCTCNQFNSEETAIECEKCQRWFHKTCSKIKQEPQICFGCRNNDIYVRNLKLPELIRRIQDIEGANQLDKASIKFLDHFSLKLSEPLHKTIFQKKNLFQIERYYLRKALESNASILQKTPNNSHNPEGINIVQIVYYLLRKEVKKESDISIEELADICHELNNKNSKFDWGQEKGEKIQKKYKKFLDGKLKDMQNDDSRTIKPKLKQFTRRNKEQTDRNVKYIALEINEIITMMNKSEVWQQIYQQYCDQSPETDSHQLIQLLYDSNLQPTAICEILSNLVLIFKARKLHRINESDYNRILYPLDDPLNAQKSTRIKNTYKDLLRNVEVNLLYNEKRQTLKKLESTMLSKDSKKLSHIKQTLAIGNILVPDHSVLQKTQTDQLEFAIIRKKYLKRTVELNAEQLHQCIALINSMVKIDQRVGTLTNQQFNNLQQVRGKYIFYANLLNYHKKTQKNAVAPVNRFVMEEEQNGQGQLIIEFNTPGDNKQHNPAIETPKSISLLIQEWAYPNYESVFFAFNQLFEVAKYNIQFDENEVVLIQNFIETILQCVYKRIITTNTKIKGELLTKMGKIVVYAHLEQTYSDILEVYQDYAEWKQQLEQKFGNIEQVLENSKSIHELLRLIEAKKVQAEDLEVDTSCQLRKLQVLKTWACLSQKILGFQKTSIQTILSLKSIMDRISYPKNAIQQRIERLELQARNLNKRICKFLDKDKDKEKEKAKMGDSEIYEELTFVRNKMTLEEAEQLKRDLESSELYVEIQLQSLLDYIKQFKAIPAVISDQFYKNAQLTNLLSLQKRILESPLMYPSVDCYYTLLLKIYQKKCEEASPQNEDILKKDYYRLLNYGGPSGAEFYSETSQLHQAYRVVEKAERQLLNGRTKPDNLLPNVGLKIRTDLKDDPVERAKVERWYQSSERLRQRYQTLRASRAEFLKYLVLQGELNRLPINNPQILAEIAKIKREIEQLTAKAKRYLGSSTNEISTLQFENPYTNEMINRYRSVCARTEYLDRFEFIYMKNKAIMELGRDVSVQNYKLFSQNCLEVAELINNNEVYKIREMAFHKMWKIYLESADPLMEIGYTLISEGGALCSHPAKLSDALPIMLNINNKFFKWSDSARRNPVKQAEEEELSQPEQEQNGNQEDSQESQLMDEYDQDEALDEEDDSPSPGKRAREDKNVVDLDDD